MVYKKEYDRFCQRLAALATRYDAEKDDCGAYWIDTNCGKLRISIEAFRRGMKHVWLYIKAEKPEKLPEKWKNLSRYTYHNGKMNNYSDDLDYLYSYLSNCIRDCRAA